MATEQKKLNTLGFGFSFFVLAAILAVVFFFLFSENFRAYRSKVTVIFIPRSETASFQSSAISENLVRFPKLLSFYERMLEKNSNLQDQFSGLSKDSRKRMWNRALDVKKDDGSTMINIEVTLKNRAQSALFARQAAHTLFDTASFYYNVKTDADFRIIEGPVTVAVTQSWYWLMLLSVVLGLIISFLLNLAFSNFAYFISGTKVAPEKIGIKKVRDEEYADYATPVQDDDFFRNVAQTSETFEKQHQAPENLPIAAESHDISFDDLSEISPAESIYQDINSREISEPTEEERKMRLNQLLHEMPEPTEEELKKRLNQLLRGEL
jgi:capsular polysaccharide biosynthesis protein